MFMDLKEYILIFKKNSKSFLAIVFLFIILGALLQFFRPPSYKASLNLNVTRTGTQETSDYKFDDFYRLQADERFADTIVRWLESPRVAVDILSDARIDTGEMTERRLSRYFKAQRFSSQFIRVTFSAGNAETAGKISESAIKILNRETQALNEGLEKEGWFKIIGGEPVVKRSGWNWPITILFSVLAGIFLGFWAMLIKHYLSD